jgi:hypothetical protein
MGLLCGLCNLIKRTFLFQIFIVFSFLRLNNLSKSAHEMKDRVHQLSNSLGHGSHPMLEKAFKDPILAFKVFLGAQVGCAIVAILGIPFLGRLAGLACAILLAANTLIYDINLPTEGKPIVWKDWQSLVSFESILSAIVIVGILAQVFSCESTTKTLCTTSECTQKKIEDVRREGQGSSKKPKKIIKSE